MAGGLSPKFVSDARGANERWLRTGDEQAVAEMSMYLSNLCDEVYRLQHIERLAEAACRGTAGDGTIKELSHALRIGAN